MKFEDDMMMPLGTGTECDDCNDKAPPKPGIVVDIVPDIKPTDEGVDLEVGIDIDKDGTADVRCMLSIKDPRVKTVIKVAGAVIAISAIVTKAIGWW